MSNVVISCGCPMDSAGNVYHNCTPIHHYGTGGVHYCPTGLKTCNDCGEVLDDNEASCTRWGN